MAGKAARRGTRQTSHRPDREMDPARYAPVMGGMRWRTPRHDFIDMWRRNGGFNLRDPDHPRKDAASPPEPNAVLAPFIVTTPPEEGREGESYAYQAHALDGVADGFTWSFEKCPPGMVVDRYGGKVTWTPTEGGRVEVVLRARSVYGKEARQCWTICVRKAVAVRPFAPNARYREALRRKATGIVRPVLRCWGVSRRGIVLRRLAAGPPPAVLPLRI